MKKLLSLAVAGLVTCASFSQSINHSLTVEIDIKSSYIVVLDTLTIPAGLFKNNEAIFYLNSKMKLTSLDENIEIIEYGSDAENINASVNLKKYGIGLQAVSDGFLYLPVQYEGEIKQEIVEGAADIARGFSQTSGIIFEKGVHLTGSSYWIPAFENAKTLTFDLTVEIDKDWNVVSQGERIINDLDGDNRIVKYLSPNPVDQVYLIAAEWAEYEQRYGEILLQAFLRTPDEQLAKRYLDATADYIRLFEGLVGPYPYSKFALVENFWETGFGMPSFTLLGEKVIRFPWILTSSYPHELLHNYWGNGVFVDYSSGNWCEGITAYMADHLIKEQQGLASEYRRNSLQKYTDYVNDENDFPLVDFRSRNNPAQEAVGYGKCMMFNDMLRLRIGDEKFKEAYSLFYENYKFKHASFNDIRESFEEVSGENLQEFFDQWINRKGAPKLYLSDVYVKAKKTDYKISFKLTQIQKGDQYKLLVPVAIYLEGEPEAQIVNINLENREKSFTMAFNQKPLKLEIDPQFNVFRQLDRNEVPTSISQVVGSENSIIILPKMSKNLSQYQNLAFMWKRSQQAQGKVLEIVYDSNIESLPADKTAWIIGYENKFADNDKIKIQYSDYLSPDLLSKIEAAKDKESLVYTFPNPENGDFTMGFVGAINSEAINNLARKITHYGKYGYLVFEGEDAKNTLSGSFPIINSPLSYDFKYDGRISKIESKLPERKALAY